MRESEGTVALGPGDVIAVKHSLDALEPLITALERDDLVQRIRSARRQLDQPNTVVCVIGEFKQGKSSLVNALVDHTVCPVDDDLATAVITVLRYGEAFTADVHHRDGAELVVERITADELAEWITEVGNPNNEKQAERVEITVPSNALSGGLVVVDTPGMGGLAAGSAAATLGFLPFADGLLFVSDASAELSEPEVEFLRAARESCGNVVFAQSKIDLYDSWREIVELNKEHLHRAGVDLRIVPVSSTLHGAASARGNEVLDGASGVPELRAALTSDLVGPAQADAANRSAADARAVIAMARSELAIERGLLRDPSRIEATLADLESTSTSLGRLYDPDSRWRESVRSGMEALLEAVAHDFRSGLRLLGRYTDEQIEQLSTAEQWDDVGRTVQNRVAELTTAGFAAIDDGVRDVQAAVSDQLAEEHQSLESLSNDTAGLDIEAFWAAATPRSEGSTRRWRSGLTGAAGVGSGISAVAALGALCQLLPAAASLMVIANPLLLGLGVVVGGLKVLDEKRSKIAARRQAAREQMRAFLDDVDFEIVDRITRTVRKADDELCENIQCQITELQQTYADTARRAAKLRHRVDAGATAERATEVDRLLDELSTAEGLLVARPTAA